MNAFPVVVHNDFGCLGWYEFQFVQVFLVTQWDSDHYCNLPQHYFICVKEWFSQAVALQESAKNCNVMHAWRGGFPHSLPMSQLMRTEPKTPAVKQCCSKLLRHIVAYLLQLSFLRLCMTLLTKNKPLKLGVLVFLTATMKLFMAHSVQTKQLQLSTPTWPSSKLYAFYQKEKHGTCLTSTVSLANVSHSTVQHC